MWQFDKHTIGSRESLKSFRSKKKKKWRLVRIASQRDQRGSFKRGRLESELLERGMTGRKLLQ